MVPWSWLSRKSTQIFLHGFLQIFVASICPDRSSKSWLLFTVRISLDYVPYPLVMTNIAIENGPVEIVDFPINSMVDLSSSLCNKLPEGKILSPPKAPSVSTPSTRPFCGAPLALGARGQHVFGRQTQNLRDAAQLVILALASGWLGGDFYIWKLLLDVAGLESVHDYSIIRDCWFQSW